MWVGLPNICVILHSTLRCSLHSLYICQSLRPNQILTIPKKKVPSAAIVTQL
jgi:hypothetical protein